jgi:RNA polymerase sigma factor (sigma-70 family)
VEKGLGPENPSLGSESRNVQPVQLFTSGGGVMDQRFFNAFYAQVFPILMRIAFRITGSLEAAEDLCQDAFIKFHEKAIPFKSPEEAKYWMIRVLKNSSLNYAKRKTRERKAYEKATRIMREGPDSGEAIALKAESVQEVQEALDKLPEKLRVVMILKEYGEMDYKQIAEVLGITEGNVKVRVFRAREALSGLVGKEAAHVS